MPHWAVEQIRVLIGPNSQIVMFITVAIDFPVQPKRVEGGGFAKFASPSSSKMPAAASLTRGQVNAVRAAFKAGVTPSRIARQFGLSHADVRKALSSDETKG
jgi:hypothetical protein